MPEDLHTFLKQIATLRGEFQAEIQAVDSAAGLQKVRIQYLGRKGPLTQFFKKMALLSGDDRPKLGEALNNIKLDIQNTVDELTVSMNSGEKEDEYIDLTLPGTSHQLGYQNPLLQVLNEIKDIFTTMGFNIEAGPEIETEYYNFEALNLPADHPARDMQDTFYLPNGYLLRTHTSPVQIRTMEKQNPPVRIIAPGRCFRKDTPDATHSPIFHQVEGLVVDKGIAFSHMKGTLLSFAQKMFGSDVKIRFRPSYYPFTEPSVDYDFSCVICSGKGCRVCKNSGWLEISGAGMVNPAVYEYINYDYEVYTGFAWGMGVERIAMMKYQIDDIRHFYDNDMRFLNQF